MESKILEILYSYRYTKKQVVDEIAKHMKNPKVRQDLIHILDILPSEINTNDMILIIKEMLKYEDTKNALLSDWQILVNDFEDGIDLFDILIKDEKIKEDIKQHPEVFEEIVLYEDLIKNYDLIDTIWEIDKRGKYLKEKLIDRIMSFRNTEFIDILIEKETMRDFIKKNINGILKNCNGNRRVTNIVYLMDKFKGFPELEDIYNKNEFVMDLYHKTVHFIKNDENFDRIEKNIYTEMTSTIFGIIIKEEKQEEIELELKDLSNGKPIEFLSLGGYSLVFQTNEKVFKLGAERAKFLIEKYHPRLMYPILRKKYNENLYIEAYEKGEIDSNITDEELLLVYEELYRTGLIWLDARKANLVRLKKDNVLPEYVRQKDDTKSGFGVNTSKHIVLKKGELVVCDLDYIYSKDDQKLISGDYIDSSDDIVKEFRKKLELEERNSLEK